MAFDAKVRDNDGLAVLGLNGEIDASAEEAINAGYEEATKNNPAFVLLDFGNVSYMNSTGIALIVGLLAEARGADRKMLVCGLTEHYKDIFEITRIVDFVTIVENEAAAVTRSKT